MLFKLKNFTFGRRDKVLGGHNIRLHPHQSDIFGLRALLHVRRFRPTLTKFHHDDDDDDDDVSEADAEDDCCYSQFQNEILLLLSSDGLRGLCSVKMSADRSVH